MNSQLNSTPASPSSQTGSGFYELPDICRPHGRLLGVYSLRSLALCVFGPWFLVTLIPLYFKYKTLRYRFGEAGVGVSWGVLWKRETYLNYSRIQDIHVSRGIFERWLGLATIHVQTAAGNSDAEASLVGLADHQAVRDFLYSRMRGSSALKRSQLESIQAEAALGIDSDPALAILNEILSEVRKLNISRKCRTSDREQGPEPSASPRHGGPTPGDDS